MSRPHITKLNKALSILNIAVALYILLVPFLPGILFFIREKTDSPPVIVSQLKASDRAFPGENRIVIPSIYLDEQILEGPSYGTLDDGIWRRPNTSTPDRGSNTVLAGHVFAYDRPEGVFYHLSKVNVGEVVAVYWGGTEYLYEVTGKQEIAADEVAIEAPSDTSILTLYTCTPLWNPVNRLVVQATLKEVTMP